MEFTPFKFWQKENHIRLIFKIALFLKGIVAMGEMVLGILAFFISQESVLAIVRLATRGELIEDPRDLVANFLLKSAETLSISTEHFTAIYLVVHGVVKFLLVVGLLRKKLWYYPASIIIFGLFIVYEIYRYTITGSLWLIVIAVFDLIVIYLTYHEYKILKKIGV